MVIGANLASEGCLEIERPVASDDPLEIEYLMASEAPLEIEKRLASDCYWCMEPDWRAKACMVIGMRMASDEWLAAVRKVASGLLIGDWSEGGERLLPGDWSLAGERGKAGDWCAFGERSGSADW
jgi:hypothetical protein